MHRWRRKIQIQLGILAAGFGCLIPTYLFTWGKATGPSMYPTIPAIDSTVYVDLLSGHLRKFNAGDVVAFTSPLDPNALVIKRLIAMPTELVRTDPKDPNSRIIRLSKGKVWVQSDNIDMGVDSRHYGPIPLTLLKGRVLFIGNATTKQAIRLLLRQQQEELRKQYQDPPLHVQQKKEERASE